MGVEGVLVSFKRPEVGQSLANLILAPLLPTIYAHQCS